MVAIIGGIFTCIQNESNLRRHYLERVALLIDDLASQDKTKKSLAIAYMKYLSEDGQIDSSLSNSLASISLKLAITDSVYDETTVKAVKENFREVFKNVTQEDTSINIRVVIHYQHETQKTIANTVKQALTEFGYDVPSVIPVDRISLSYSQLRYFRKRDLEDAESIKNQLNNLNLISEVVLNDLTKYYENSTKIRPRSFELWLKYK